jgi:DNA-binding NarL/FixJ family response regulator
MSPSDRPTGTLLALECVVLAASANGLGVRGVAALLDLPADVVRAVIGTAIEKLNARSKRDAVSIALRMGQLDLPR